MKYARLLAIFICISLTTLTHAQMVVDRIVGQVGGEIILLSDLKERLSFMESNYGTLDEDSRCYIIESIFQEKLLLHQARLDSVFVADAEVEAQLDARFSRILSQMNNDESQFEEYYGATVAEKRKEMWERQQSDLLVSRMQQEIMSEVEATPSEVKEFFNSIPKDSLPYFNAEVEVAELVYTPPYNADEKQRAIERLEGVRQRIVEGESFASLAEIFSDDPGSRNRGGDLGYVQRGAMVPEFEAAAFNLEEGELSEIVETDFGYHLIRVEERRGQSIRVSHILIRPELTEEDKQKAHRLLDSIRALVQNDSMTFEAAVKEWGDEDVRSYNNGGRMANPQTGTSYFEISQLDSEVYFAIDELDEGDVSEPVPFEQIAGDFKYKLFYLLSRTKPHQASLQKDYSRIQELASEDKRNRQFVNWLNRKLETTYVEYDHSVINCSSMQSWVENN